MSVPIGSNIQVVFHYSGDAASEALNTFMFQNSAVLDDTDLLDAVEDWIDDDWGPAWADFASNKATLTYFEVNVLNDDGTVADIIGSRNIALAGTVTGEQMPGGVAGYMQLDTDEPKVRGRKYLPFIGEGSSLGGYLNAETLADIVVLAALWLSGIDVGVVDTLVAGVLSRKLAQFVPFTERIFVTDVPAYQRRRKPNVGS